MNFYARVGLALWFTLTPLAWLALWEENWEIGDAVFVAAVTLVVSVIVWTAAVFLVVLWDWALHGAP